MTQHDYLILHGVNLNMFGRRDPAVYGTATLDDINNALRHLASQMDVTLDFYQSNYEGALVDRIHKALTDGTRGVVINAGAWTHYSYALLDALDILHCPVVEVHMSHVQGILPPPVRHRAGLLRLHRGLRIKQLPPRPHGSRSRRTGAGGRKSRSADRETGVNRPRPVYFLSLSRNFVKKVAISHRTG